jgi:hypothetical protein
MAELQQRTRAYDLAIENLTQAVAYASKHQVHRVTIEAEQALEAVATGEKKRAAATKYIEPSYPEGVDEVAHAISEMRRTTFAP